MIRILAAALFATTALAQSSDVVGVGTFIHVVADLDKTMRFYGDDLGLERNGAPGPRAFSVNPVVEGLYDAKGSQSRVAVFRIPGSPLGVEFAEFKDVSQKPVRPNVQDPGASVLVLSLPNIDSVITRLKADGLILAGDGLVRDPDGFFVQLVQGEAGAKLKLTVASLDRTLQLFRDQLGFRPETGKDSVATAKVPGTDFEVEFVGYKGANRQPVRAGIHDPGAGVLRLMVRDVDSLLARLKAAGVPVASAGGEPVTLGPNRHAVILRGPDGFFFQLVPGPAGGR
jgi:catechol 2,3-dioxygenase-like lactoylglutathione lyase family enzyme